MMGGGNCSDVESLALLLPVLVHVPGTCTVAVPSHSMAIVDSRIDHTQFRSVNSKFHLLGEISPESRLHNSRLSRRAATSYVLVNES